MWTWRSADSLYEPGTAAHADEWMKRGRLCEEGHVRVLHRRTVRC